MNNRIIFIGGIHGVGKGTICKKISSECSIPHFSASQLLKWHEISARENKLVDDFATTQERLLFGIDEHILPGTIALLDGHFCLLNSEGIPEKIADETFLKINPIAIGVVIEDVIVVKQRLEARDSKEYHLEILQQMQEMEVEHANNIASTLQIPIFLISSNKFSDLIDYIKEAG